MNRSSGLFLLNIAVALYLFATGILGLAGRGFFPDGEIRRGVTAMLVGNFAEAVIVILSVLSIAAGAFILLKFFGIGFPMARVMLPVIAIAWVFFIITIDIIHPLNSSGINFVDWLRGFGSHLMVLAAIAMTSERLSR